MAELLSHHAMRTVILLLRPPPKPPFGSSSPFSLLMLLLCFFEGYSELFRKSPHSITDAVSRLLSCFRSSAFSFSLDLPLAIFLFPCFFQTVDSLRPLRE